MGRSNKVPYGFYRGHGFINPFLALGDGGTGFTYGDLRLFFDGLLRMFDSNPSSSQGTMAIRGVHLFEHESTLGNARASELLERVRIKPLSEDPDPDVRARAPRKFDDYRNRIHVDLSSLPKGVTYHELPRDFDRLFSNAKE
jgi:CRISPR-associated protein Csd2